MLKYLLNLYKNHQNLSVVIALLVLLYLYSNGFRRRKRIRHPEQYEMNVKTANVCPCDDNYTHAVQSKWNFLDIKQKVLESHVFFEHKEPSAV